jgi:hypothetical protein
LHQRITPYIFFPFCLLVFHDCISNREKSHDDGRNDAPSEGEFFLAIQTIPAVKVLVYPVGAVSEEHLAGQTVPKEKAYTPDIIWFQLAPSGMSHKTAKRTSHPLVLLDGRRADSPRCILSCKVSAMHTSIPWIELGIPLQKSGVLEFLEKDISSTVSGE